MCGTCGCQEEGAGYKILKASGAEAHSHTHDHEHTHDHYHHHHTHTHDHGDENQPHEHSHVHEGFNNEGKHHLHNGEDSKKIILEADVLQHNNMLANRNRGFFEAREILALNLVSSPGSGKTTLLEQSIKLVEDKNVYVIEGDQQTTLDAKRIEQTGAKVLQINTGSGCHLDADMVYHAVKELNPAQGSVLFIENVGNLVCPALFDLGENYRLVIISVTEGEDKPLKYPTMFQSAQVCVINKADLIPYIEFDIEKLKDYAIQVNPDLIFFEVSAKTGEGMDGLLSWIKQKQMHI